MKLPVVYDDIPPEGKYLVRAAYITQQNHRCYHCNGSLTLPAPAEIMNKPINRRLFPDNFFQHPVHLHHSRKTGLTLGAVHCHCNAVLWQYHGE